MAKRLSNVLFLCTGNSARSILAESILRRDGGDHFQSFSAGSDPKGQVNPLALKVLRAMNYPSEGFRSKSWDEFAGPGAPDLHYIITVCDNAAGEVCPIWPGRPMSAHWGIKDPAAVTGTDAEREQAFRMAFTLLKTRIASFLALPLATMDQTKIADALRGIGAMDGATGGHGKL